MSLIGDIGRGMMQLVYPAACAVCDVLLEAGELCQSCRDAVTVDPFPTCPNCASTVGPNLGEISDCPRCRNESFAFDAAIRGGPYDGVRRDAVLRMKRDEALAEILGEIFAERLRTARADAVIPVPLHWWRRWRRGFNQSEILAETIAKQLRLPFRPRWLRRVRPTRAQTSLSATARRENLRGAFAARPVVAGQTVILVDDVLTTGSTASECARALKKAGAKRVIAAAFAHG